jgi:hypothetical protein
LQHGEPVVLRLVRNIRSAGKRGLCFVNNDGGVTNGGNQPGGNAALPT